MLSAGDSPRDGPARERLLEEAVAAYLDARQSGAFDRDALLSRYAPVAEDLAALFAAEQRVGAALSPPSSALQPPDTPASPPAASAPTDLESFGTYGDFRVIGSGGMGVVYRCRDAELGRTLALKVMHAHLASVPERAADFLEEAQVASQLTHPNIAPVYEYGKVPDGRPYFTMKLVEGRTLGDLVREYHTGPTPAGFDGLLRHFVAVCNAVAYAHQRKVLHRDLKPANVMVGAFGEVQVMDWGLSKVVPRSQTGHLPGEPPGTLEAVQTGSPDVPTEPGLVRGTFAYMPPEQAGAEGPVQDVRSDVFALGAILCEILTGLPPYTSAEKDPWRRGRELWQAARTWAIEPAFGRLDSSRAPAEIVALVKLCLARRPEDRPASATQVAGAVTAYLAGVQEKLRAEEVRRARAEAKAAEERVKRRWQLSLAGAVMVLVMSLVGGWLWYRIDQANRQAGQAGAEAEARRRLDDPLREARLLREKGRPLEALEAVRRAEALSQDERIPENLREDVHREVAEFAGAVAAAARDQRLMDRLLDVITALEGPEAFVGREPPDLDLQIAEAFREAGLDVSKLSDQELIEYLTTRPVEVRLELAAGLDVWAVTSRRYPRNAALSARLVKLARAIDPDPARDELRGIIENLRVGSPWFNVWVRVVAPLESLLPKSNYNRLLEIAGTDPKALPPLTVRLLAVLLQTVKETGSAIKLVRQAVHVYPTNPSLHFMAAALLAQDKRQILEAIGHLQSLRALRPRVGSFLALLLAGAGRGPEALTVCEELRRLGPEEAMPAWTHGMVLNKLKRYPEAEKVLREAAGRHPDSSGIQTTLALALHEQKKSAEAEKACREALRLQPEWWIAYNNLGLALEGQRKYAEAEAALRKALSLFNQPEGADGALLHSSLGAVLAARKKYAEALTECQLAVSLDEGSSYSYNNLATALAGLGRWKEAELCVRKALQLDGEDPRPHVNLALVLLRQNKLAEARVACENALRLQPDCAPAYNVRGLICEEEKKYPDATEAFQAAIRLDPLDPEAHCNLGTVLLQLSKLEQAEASCRQALRLAPKDSDVLKALGGVLRGRKKYAEAAEAYQKAIDLAPDDPAGHSGLALVYDSWGKRQAAVDEYRKAVALRPREAKYHRYLGRILAEQGKDDDAIRELQAALQIDPDDARANRSLGIQFLKVKRPAEALAPLRRAATLKPGDSLTFYFLGCALEESGKREEAILAYERSHTLEPDNADSLAVLCMALQTAGRYREAEAAYLRLIRLEPRDPEHHINLGLIRYNRHRFAAAVDAYREAIRLDPRHINAYVFMGYSLMALGRFPEALEADRKALEIEPHHHRASKAVAIALLRLGKFKEAQEVLDGLERELPRDSPERAEVRKERLRVQTIREMDTELADYLSGKKRPSDTASWLYLAELYVIRGQDAPAVRSYAAAFESDPKQADDLQRNALLRAVGCAVRAALRSEASTDERSAFHRQARAWLTSERAQLERQTGVGAESAADFLRFWQETPSLQEVRGSAALAKLPEAERKAWQQFWAEVDALLKKLDSPVLQQEPGRSRP